MNEPLKQAIGPASATGSARDYQLFMAQNDSSISSFHSHSEHNITITHISTPLGPMFAGATDSGICLLEFTDRQRLESQIKRLKKYLKAEFVTGDHLHLNQLKQQLEDYFAGSLTRFSLPLDVPGSEFQQQVWHELQQIPFGTTRSYLEQAQAIGNANAVRAVAKANGDNRIAILIPCHRVIGKNGYLTGYAGGIWRKQRLLELEDALPQQYDLLSNKA